ncbi:MAG: DUF364 domain-containing protein [Bacteroidales bacterium]
MQEPIRHFFEKYGVNHQEIKDIVCGEKYVAVLLKNGHIGVCATLGNYVNLALQDLRIPDPDNIQHRIVLNAYFNAKFNYENNYDHTIDIFDKINFKQYQKIVMIGFFKSLVEKFERENTTLTIFDKAAEDEKLTDMSEQLKKISEADAVILSSTTVFNRTFLELVNATREKCDIYTLGPSTILQREMFQYKNIKLLFGSVFEPNDINTLKIIQNGGGTKQFLPFMNKVFLKP